MSFEITKEAVLALYDRINALEAENAKLKRGEWFYDCEDGENSSGDWSDVLDYADFDGPMLIAGAREVERFWIARVVLTWDEDGSPDDSEIRRFATKAEALAAMRRVSDGSREAGETNGLDPKDDSAVAEPDAIARSLPSHKEGDAQ